MSPVDLRSNAWRRLQEAQPAAWVLDHARHVAGMAACMVERGHAAGLELDEEFVVAAALLHDIGRSKTHDVRHAGVGADMLREDLVWSEALIRCVERHTGAGVTAGEAEPLGLPQRDYVPQSIEERIVAHADNLYSGSTRLTLAMLESKYQAKGLHLAWRRIEAMHLRLCGELRTDLETLEVSAWQPATP